MYVEKVFKVYREIEIIDTMLLLLLLRHLLSFCSFFPGLEKCKLN